VSSTRSKVLVAMSGGVDSSVAAAMLVRAGHDVVGCFMRLGSPGETLDELLPDAEACRLSGKGLSLPQVKIGHQGCCSITDAADARAVAAELGIPFYVCNFKKDFGRIIDYFVDEYVSGKTPNPCVRCNDWLKFGKLHEYAGQIGAQVVASGHYARIADAGGEPAMFRGRDASKDQSYVLFGVPRAQLTHMRFPVGDLPKSEVRELARRWGLPVFDKPDSQEICFVPDNDYASLVDRRRPEAAREGRIVDELGRELGRHEGQHRFTIGQRRGLDVAVGERIYVVGKDAATNTVVVGGKERLFATGCDVGEANWLCDPSKVVGRRLLAKFRYNTPASFASVQLLDDGEGATPSGRAGRFRVVFEEPQAAVAAGQAVVLYDDDRVLGGGWIESARPMGP
jgi:tRNA-uridine 2-sulfurtransferase